MLLFLDFPCWSHSLLLSRDSPINQNHRHSKMTGRAVVQWCNAWSHLLWLTQALHLKPHGSAGMSQNEPKMYCRFIVWPVSQETNKLWGSPKTAGQVQVLGKNVPRLTWTSGLLRIYDYFPSRKLPIGKHPVAPKLMGQVYSSIFGASHRQLGWLDAQYLRLLKVLFNIVQPKIDRRFTPLKFLKPWYAKLSPTTKLAGPNPYPTAPRDVESFELRAGMACCRAEKGAQRGSREVSQGRCHSYDDFLVFSINMIIGVLFV